MVTKSIKLFFAVSLIFYIILGLYLWISIDSIKDEEMLSAAAASENLQSAIDSAYAFENSFTSEYFSERMNKIFEEDQRLRAVIVYTESSGPLYLRLNDSRILRGRPGAEDGWESGHPELALSSPGLTAFRSQLHPESSILLTSVYNLFNRGRFLPVLRNTLLAAVSFLALTIIFLSMNRTAKPRIEIEAVAEAVAEESSQPDSETSHEDTNLREKDEDCPGLYSPKSGLVWEQFLTEKLSAELKRAASFDQDACLVFISIFSPSGFIPYRNISELIIEYFTYRDLAFEAGEDTFCVIIPDKDIDEGLGDVEKFQKSILARFPDSAYRLYAGLTSRNSRLLSEKRMIQEAKAALSKAVSEPESTTMSFRTDLSKYRDYIASTI